MRGERVCSRGERVISQGGTVSKGIIFWRFKRRKFFFGRIKKNF